VTSPAEIFARSFERFLLFVGRHGECRQHREPDTFDGTAYDSRAFAAFNEPNLARPADFYGYGAAMIEPSEIAPRRGGYITMAFPSPYASGFPENDRASFKWFRSSPDATTAVVFAPGWPRADQAFEERVARRLVRRGIDVALLTVPFHQARTPAGAYSGEFFISSNPLWTIENVRQFVAEIRAVMRWLRARYSSVGVAGLSSGAIPAGLAAHCDVVDFYVPIMSASDLAGLMWSSSITAGIRAQLLAHGVTRDDLERYWGIADLARIRTRLDSARVLQILTRYDDIIPFEFQEALWVALGQPARAILPTSHFGIVFFADTIARLISEFAERQMPAKATASAAPLVAPERR
jgi:hypothetical protein